MGAAILGLPDRPIMHGRLIGELSDFGTARLKSVKLYRKEGLDITLGSGDSFKSRPHTIGVINHDGHKFRDSTGLDSIALQPCEA